MPVGLRPAFVSILLLLLNGWVIRHYTGRLTLYYTAPDANAVPGVHERNLAIVHAVQPLASPRWMVTLALAIVVVQLVGARLAGGSLRRWHAWTYAACSALCQTVVSAALVAGGLVVAMVIAIAGARGGDNQLFADGYIDGPWIALGLVYVPVVLVAAWVTCYSLWRIALLLVGHPQLTLPASASR
jgi:hypothetical protein